MLDTADTSMPRRPTIRFEGLTEEELLGLDPRDIDALILTGEPAVVTVGSATVLGRFELKSDRLLIELVQIEGGGEGVLLALVSLARRLAAARTLTAIEWVVHAVACAKPNLKLRRVLERRGFEIREGQEGGEAYYFVEKLAPAPPAPSTSR